MAMEISVITVGAVILVLLLLMVLITCKRDTSLKENHKGTKAGLLQNLHQLLPHSSSPSLPGPPSFFLIGNMMELTHDHLPIHLTNLAQRYGNIYRLKCGNTTMVVLNSSEVIREALVKKWSDFAGRPVSYTGDIVSGGGHTISLGDYNEEWRAHRRLVHSALQRCCQQSLHSVIERQALHLRKVLMDYQGSAVDLSEDFTVAASNVITTLAFGKEYNKTSSELQQLHSCLNEIVALWGSSWISALDSFPLLRVSKHSFLTKDQGKTNKHLLSENSQITSFVLSKKLPNPVFSRLLKEVAKRDEIIKEHLNNYKLLLCHMCSHKTKDMRMPSQDHSYRALKNNTTQNMEW
ncbi:hypothetical protein F7725_018597 [Dissostichus mawsoni]|uniref:Steroid 21-hydroxylase n=1 Tax=Dissostichus mawsoni TaxID=36200 RepID=A0A7J5XS09_DISMA|nr:hypothetical protein F7725_018597 [Dissostichus mawsoni]